MNARRSFLLVLVVLLLAPALLLPGPGAAAPPADRGVVAPVPSRILEAQRVGRADPDQPMERMMMVLPSKDLEGRNRFLDAQQTPGAPEHRRWLSPARFHERFGADPRDVRAVTRWLEEQGFSVEPGHAGRSTLLFSGTAAQVEAAFATRIGLYARNGEPRIANETPATLPAALSGRVVGFVSLDGLSRREPLSLGVRPASDPLYNSGSNHLLAPADFATIYNLDGLAAQGIDGAGRSVAVIGRTQVNMDDTRTFRSFMALPPNEVQVVLNGPDPGILPEDGEVVEANLDIQWSGATAPRAKITFVVSKSTATADGVDLSIQHAVEQNLADAATVSFGACERDITPAGMTFYDSMWAQAAAQGISAFIASGDSGAAGCDSAGASSGTGVGMNGLATSPWNTCVGGTQFMDTPASAYWAPANDPVTKKSVLSYIPEKVWNESGAAGGSKLWSAGGGPSIFFPRPSWQHGPGLPTDAWRSLPDISLAAAQHTGYLVRWNSGFYGVAGTSASSPAMSGVGALLAQKAGGRVGNLNPTLYALGRSQYGASGAKVFRDVTTGNNSVPNVTGFSAGTAYDMGSGLGSVDATEFAGAWSASAPPPNLDFFVGVAPGALLMAAGGSASLAVTLSTVSGLDVTARFALSGLPSGMSATYAPSQLSTATAGYVSAGVPAKLTLTASATTAAGTYPLTLTATAGTVQRRLTLFVTVSGAAIPPASGVETQVPVVLDVFGAAGSHYTSDLVAVNRSTSDATLQLRFVPAPGTSGSGGPIVSRSLPAGRQLYVADVIALLKANGYAFASDGSKLGTLYVTFAGVADQALVFAGSRTSTPNQNTAVGGAFGTFSAAVPSGTGATGEAWVYGLRESSSFRSNLAVVHAPGGSSSLSGGTPMGVEVQVYDGSTGAASGLPVARTLQPGEFWQLNSVLGTVTNGYARVKRTTGTDRFITYGVVNDGGAAAGSTGTSDGSLIVSGGTDGLIPIVLDLPGGTHYQTEVSLTNTASTSRTVTLTYTPAAVFGGSGGGTKTLTMAAGQQVQQTNGIAWLRSLGFAIPADGKQGGTLLVSGAAAMARTYSANPDTTVGGTYGVAYPALGGERRAKTGAWVYGLRQDADVRSNLAIADARAGDVTTREYTIEVFDADSGSTSPVATISKTLAGGQWTQVDGILSAAGIAHGYARVRPMTPSDFIAYGVVNDGPGPGSRTSDGSYLPMVVGD